MRPAERRAAVVVAEVRRPMPETVKVHVRHVRQARLCTGGMRAWLKLHGIEPMEMIRDGIAAERLEATGDHFALKVCELARAEAAEVAKP